MSNLKNRVSKIEHDNQPSGFVVIAVNDGETNEDVYKRHFDDVSIKPKTVVFTNGWDVLL